MEARTPTSPIAFRGEGASEGRFWVRDVDKRARRIDRHAMPTTGGQALPTSRLWKQSGRPLPCKTFRL